MATMSDSALGLQGKKERKKREKKGGKELLQIGEPEAQLSCFEDLEHEVRDRDSSPHRM